jgi:N-acetylglucosaminyl-diphospho-decaprenol L-rhamnosyltransferase
MVTWNSRDVTVDAIERFLASDQGCDVRLMVRDNASTDGTPEAIRERFPEVEIEFGEENLGFAGGMNRLIARSDAPWFFPLNSDAWPEDQCLATLARVAEHYPKAAALAPLLLRPDGTLEHSTHPFPSPLIALMVASGSQRWRRRRGDEFFLERVWMHDRTRVVDWAVGAALLMRREALDEIGPFDDGFFMYAEDLEWCWRARQRGWEIVFEPSAVVRHIGNVSGKARFGQRRTATYMANTYRFYADEHGRAAMQVLRGLNVAGAARHLAAAKLARDQPRTNYWRAMVRAYMGRGAAPDPRHG